MAPSYSPTNNLRYSWLSAIESAYLDGGKWDGDIILADCR